jgi:hypothetical protein
VIARRCARRARPGGSLVEPRAAGSRARENRFAISGLPVSVGVRPGERSVIELDECPGENEIVDFVDGALSDLERARIEAHCAICERYAPGPARACVEQWNGSTGVNRVCTPWS